MNFFKLLRGTVLSAAIGWTAIAAADRPHSVLVTPPHSSDPAPSSFGDFVTDQPQTFAKPHIDIDVAASEMGVVDEVLVRVGDRVDAGQLIARLDDSVLRSSLEVARAAKDAKAEREDARIEASIRHRQFVAYETLFSEGNLTRRELELAEQASRQSAARLAARDEQLRLRALEFDRVRAQIDRRQIRSPISGWVVAIDKHAGEFVSPTDPVVMRIVDVTRLRATFALPTADVMSLIVGQTVRLRIGGVRREGQGEIESLSPLVDSAGGTREVAVLIDNRSNQYVGGMPCFWSTGSRP